MHTVKNCSCSQEINSKPFDSWDALSQLEMLYLKIMQWYFFRLSKSTRHLAVPEWFKRLVHQSEAFLNLSKACIRIGKFVDQKVPAAILASKGPTGVTRGDSTAAGEKVHNWGSILPLKSHGKMSPEVHQRFHKKTYILQLYILNFVFK